MIKQTQIEDIRNYIVQNETLKAINSLKLIIFELFENFKKTISILESDLKRLKGDSINGLISSESYNLEIRKIHNRILDLIEALISEINENKMLNMESSLVLDPISRQENIGRYSKLLYDEGQYGVIRQQAVLSTFSVPNRESSDQIWIDRDKKNPRTIKHFKSSLLERKWIENHVKQSYGRLIIQPSIAIKISEERGKAAAILRLQCMLDFFENNTDKLDIVLSNKPIDRNIIIVGDWFFSTSDTPTIRGHEETYFEWDKERVEQTVKDFDIKFNSILKEKNLNVYEAKYEAIDEIEKILDKIKNG